MIINRYFIHKIVKNSYFHIKDIVFIVNKKVSKKLLDKQ